MLVHHHAPLIFDVSGTSLSDADRRRLQHPLCGGVIHFARNWSSREQLTALNAEIKAIRPDALILVDHEGGRVQRFKTGGFTHLCAMRTLGRLWQQDPMQATQAATAVGYVMATELRACGVDMSFAPVLDLDWTDAQGNSQSRVVGDRAYHADARVVTLLAKSLMHGQLLAGMASCGKHFPGHGFVQADSHVAVPVDKRSLKTILASDAKPFEWLANSLQAVMPAHVVYPKVDSKPAGFSNRWLQDVLRGQAKGQLGFQGAVFSDDLSMAGARVIEGFEVSTTVAACAALNAGCDMALLCNQSAVDNGAPLDAWLDGMSEALLKHQWQASEASEQRRRALLPTAPALDWAALQTHGAYISAIEQCAMLNTSSRH